MQKTISVRFGHSESDKSYDYKLAPALATVKLQVGDRLVVQVGQNLSCSVGVVTRLHTEPSPDAKLWAFQLVDGLLNESLPRA